MNKAKRKTECSRSDRSAALSEEEQDCEWKEGERKSSISKTKRKRPQDEGIIIEREEDHDEKMDAADDGDVAKSLEGALALAGDIDDHIGDTEIDGEEKEQDEEQTSTTKEHVAPSPNAAAVDSADDDDEEPARRKKKKRKKVVHKLSMSETNDFNERLKKRGVMYVARIPPRMTPTKIKQLLSDFGAEVTRVYLAPEDASKRKQRRRLTGSRGGKRYTEGWVEFSCKEVARRVAACLNCTPVSGNKRSVHRDDLWNVKYLRKFAWSHLTEKVAYERRVREQKLRLETMQAKRECAAYKKLVETGRKLDKIHERKQRKKRRKLLSEQQQQQRRQQEANKEDGKDKKKKSFHHRQVQPIRDEYSGDQTAKRALLDALV